MLWLAHHMNKNFIFQCLVIVVGMLGSFAVMLYLCTQLPNYTLTILLLWLLCWLIGYRIKTEYRYMGSLVIVLNVIYTFLFGGLLMHLLSHYGQIYNNLTYNQQAVIDNVVEFLYKLIPNIMLNVLFLVGVVYSLILLTLRIILVTFINKGKINQPFLNSLFQVGYNQKQDSWVLIPHFLFIKPFAYLFFIYALSLIGYFWWANQSMPMIEWVFWFTPFLIFLAVDWWIWLSGKVQQLDVAPDFWGEEGETFFNEQSFEDLWRKYHKFWLDKWLVAGNKTTGGKE